jgi:uncharacterized protein (TIGR02452 family)
VSSRLRAIARETVSIAERGGYGSVDIRDEVAYAVAGTRLYTPEDPLPGPVLDKGLPRVEVINQSTLDAAHRLARDGGSEPACLVFASARNPGGGFLNGAQAQEESLARASALYACLTSVPDFYTYHRERPELTYSDRVIFSPSVPVFRDDKGRLLDTPYRVAFLTAAAPNYGAILRNQPEHADAVPEILHRRAGRVLDIAAAHGRRRLVLGAWGCGVFANLPVVVARAFAEQLARPRGFELVVFAVLDRQRGTPTFAAFAETLGAEAPEAPA